MASKRRQRRRVCERKQKHSKDEAFRIALRMRKQHPHQKIDAYQCPECGQWHVGHRPGRVEKIIKSRRRNNN